MKAAFAVGLALLALATWSASAQGPDDQYIGIYGTIQQADALLATGQNREATSRYLQAQTALRRLQTAYPDWNSRVVNFRLNYIAAKLAASTVPAPATPVVTAGVTPAEAPPAAQPDAALLAELRQLRELVGQLQADKGLLEAKLKEAFAIQPAAADPRELAQANDRITSLEKENDLLKVTLDQERTRKPVADTAESERFRQQLAEANRKLATQTERADTLALEKTALQQRFETLASTPSSTADLEQTRHALAEATQKLTEQTTLSRQLAQDKDALQNRVRTLTADAEAAAALRAENELLKRQLADLKTPASRGVADRDLKQARAQIAALQSDLEILRLERTALENRVRSMSTPTTVASAALSPATPAADAERLRQLERERDELQKKLDTAVQELAGSRSKSAAARVQEMTEQLTTLRARLEILEARQIPYTTEELALMKQPAPRLATADPRATRRSVRELPSGSAALVAEAQRQFAARQYDSAEENYLRVLREDQRNAAVLANLAVIQMELNKLDEAEKQARQAISVAPDDAYSHSVFGQVRLRQEKYDEAVDALSRAAQLNPRGADIQNFLGIALSHRGLRGPAETALRKAIQLEPGYASAHNNLAVIYLNQNPPMVELARWHYQRALAAGHAKNLELEKALEAK